MSKDMSRNRWITAAVVVVPGSDVLAELAVSIPHCAGKCFRKSFCFQTQVKILITTVHYPLTFDLNEVQEVLRKIPAAGNAD